MVVRIMIVWLTHRMGAVRKRIISYSSDLSIYYVLGGGGSQKSGYGSSNVGYGSGDAQNYGGGYVSTKDPNYGGGGVQQQQQQQPPSYGVGQQQHQAVSVTGYGYDVLSQGPDYPARNFPSMHATVGCTLIVVFSRLLSTCLPSPSSCSTELTTIVAAQVTDYSSQDYNSPRNPRAQQPPASEYWPQTQQQPQSQQFQGSSDYSAQQQSQQFQGSYDYSAQQQPQPPQPQASYDYSAQQQPPQPQGSYDYSVQQPSQPQGSYDYDAQQQPNGSYEFSTQQQQLQPQVSYDYSAQQQQQPQSYGTLSVLLLLCLLLAPFRGEVGLSLLCQEDSLYCGTAANL